MSRSHSAFAYEKILAPEVQAVNRLPMGYL